MNVLLLGSGGREHALAWSLSRSKHLSKLYIAPGNPGTAQEGTNVDLSPSDFEAVVNFIEEHDIGLTVVGPEKPLVEGIVDFLDDKGHKVFGPSKSAAKLEGSKKFANEFMKKNRIPTADFESYTRDRFDEAFARIKQENEYPVVLKADGLAGGKGVFVCETEEDVKHRFEQLKEGNRFGGAADTVVVEEFLEGEEASVFVISDGETAKVLHNAQDHKRIGEGDTGLNTGGMGAYSPAPIINPEMLARVEKEIVLPTITAMQLDGNPYKGILYCGLMITEEGPKVVEYNCRFGDPECQAILPSIKNDMLKLMLASSEGTLNQHIVELDDQYRCCVVIASEGYPKEYETGKEISGIDQVSSDAYVFHAGTALADGRLVTDGGRVLNVVDSGDTLQDAIRHTYEEVKKISFENAYYRSDIGVKGLAHLED
ncbi:MAG: phosphoribosylamine--glycine ligase [Balneolaceae bacterium]|nr:phosphoribosylamine--glycine ligase [Balneolaceae bacterium]